MLATAIDFHRAVKMGLFCSCDDPSHKHRGLVDIAGYDVFGRLPQKAPIEAFPCPNCGTLRQPLRFASHLEKCMGRGGRESRRVAGRNAKAAITSSTTSSLVQSSSHADLVNYAAQSQQQASESSTFFAIDDSPDLVQSGSKIKTSSSSASLSIDSRNSKKPPAKRTHGGTLRIKGETGWVVVLIIILLLTFTRQMMIMMMSENCLW